MCVLSGTLKNRRGQVLFGFLSRLYMTPLAFIEIILFFKTFFKLGSLKKRANSKIIFVWGGGRDYKWKLTV